RPPHQTSAAAGLFFIVLFFLFLPFQPKCNLDSIDQIPKLKVNPSNDKSHPIVWLVYQKPNTK
ncbi:hypothetical protein, partial [Neisseria polysaccharea]